VTVRFHTSAVEHDGEAQITPHNKEQLEQLLLIKVTSQSLPRGVINSVVPDHLIRRLEHVTLALRPHPGIGGTGDGSNLQRREP